MSPHGLWILIDDQELFLGFTEFPWFAQATIRELTRVERPSPHHLYWPDLDVDLAVESIKQPDAYPLVSKVQSKNRLRRTKARRTSRRV